MRCTRTLSSCRELLIFSRNPEPWRTSWNWPACGYSSSFPRAWKQRLFGSRAGGRQLAAALVHLKDEKPIVLALPRGGVPVGYEVAKALDAPLDVIMVRKIGAPGHKELGIGAVVDGANPQLVLNEDVVAW